MVPGSHPGGAGGFPRPETPEKVELERILALSPSSVLASQVPGWHRQRARAAAVNGPWRRDSFQPSSSVFQKSLEPLMSRFVKARVHVRGPLGTQEPKRWPGPAAPQCELDRRGPGPDPTDACGLGSTVSVNNSAWFCISFLWLL